MSLLQATPARYGLRDSDFEFPSKNFYVAMEGKGVEGIRGSFQGFATLQIQNGKPFKERIGK